MPRKRDPRLKRAGVRGFNIPKRTPGHRTKSHIVVAKVGNKIKTIRFGQQGAKTAGKPKKGESARMKAKRKSFKARRMTKSQIRSAVRRKRAVKQGVGGKPTNVRTFAKRKRKTTRRTRRRR